MDTERIIPASLLRKEQVHFAALNDAERGAVTKYVELVRHIQEIGQLFSVFRYHLERLTQVYDLTASDAVVRRLPPAGDFDDRTEINALITALLGAGATLDHSLQVCIRHSGADTEAFDRLRTQVYDSSFYYRLLTKLRDFSQHGHLAVSVRDGRFAFDLAQILATPHFRHKAETRQEMEAFCAQLSAHEREGRLVFTLSLAEYAAGIAALYDGFFRLVRQPLTGRTQAVRALLQRTPEHIRHPDPSHNGILLYISDGTGHALDTREDFSPVFDRLQEEGARFLQFHRRELALLRRSGHFVPLDTPSDAELS